MRKFIMLSTITRIGWSRTISYSSTINNLHRILLRSIPAVCDNCNRGYGESFSLQYFSKRSKDTLNKLNCIAAFSSDNQSVYSPQIDLSIGQFEQISNETLESLTEYFDELIEQAAHLKDADVSYGDGVLTIKFGEGYGTYVINRQTPNKQIWLSSPKSGPKRYDFIDGKWIYKHDGQTLHELLNREIPAIIRNQAIFDKCSYSGREQHVSLDRS